MNDNLANWFFVLMAATFLVAFLGMAAVAIIDTLVCR